MATDEYTITVTLEPPTTKATVFQPITLETSVPVTEVVSFPNEENLIRLILIDHLRSLSQAKSLPHNQEALHTRLLKCQQP